MMALVAGDLEKYAAAGALQTCRRVFGGYLEGRQCRIDVICGGDERE